MEIKSTKDLVKLIQYYKEPSAFYLDYKSGDKYKHVLWKYDDFNMLLARIDSDLESKGMFSEDIVIESVEVCMNLLDSHRFIKVFASERSLVD